ncbi:MULTISPECIES: hypothetical protein [Bacillus]|nr:MULTISPECIES: hypothetical protein [Bacillus]
MNTPQSNFKEKFKNSIEHELVSAQMVARFEAYYSLWKGQNHEENTR